MLDLTSAERQDLLEAFHRVILHLRDNSDEKAITALALCNKGKFDEALKCSDEALEFDLMLTSVKSYLQSEYKKVVSLH
jgi:tetratricopeptide (TPR) repeat protein